MVPAGARPLPALVNEMPLPNLPAADHSVPEPTISRLLPFPDLSIMVDPEVSSKSYLAWRVAWDGEERAIPPRI